MSSPLPRITRSLSSSALSLATASATSPEKRRVGPRKRLFERGRGNVLLGVVQGLGERLVVRLVWPERRELLVRPPPQDHRVRAGNSARAVPVDLRVAPGLPDLRGDRLLLREALHNLVANAIEACSETGGRVAVSVRTVASGAGGQ